ncbi:cyclin-P isoform X2 [Eublepharis macularius]|uniref:Cyclin-P isoform X2 n=1 Tax=Eublepharis macularius TaxID=481883 RepID=A0AA97KFZ6_EUBMA|nr:cyclin-P isoform X2 [Eublepharis macularius]
MAGASAQRGVPGAAWAGGAAPGAGRGAVSSPPPPFRGPTASLPGPAAAQGRVAGAGRLGPASPAGPPEAARPLLRRAARPQAEEKREPLRSKNGGRGCGQVWGGQGGAPEKPGAACARSAAAAGTPRQRGREGRWGPGRAGPGRPAASGRKPPSLPPSGRFEALRPGLARSRGPGPAVVLSVSRPAAAPLSAPLGQELCRALQRMQMGVEQEYAYDILRSLMEQPRYTFRAADVPRAMTAERRALIVDWLVQVHEYLKLADDTLYLAVYLMNAYLTRSPLRVGLLQLLSLACLFLACKVEESSCPPPAQLCFMAEDSFSPKDLLGMERKILSRLKFELHYANPVSLLRLLAEVGWASLEVQYLAMYFMELSLMETDSVVVEPAQLAVAALCLAQRVLCDGTAGAQAPQGSSQGPQGSPARLHMYSEAELSVVYPSMARAALRGGRSALQATFRKYSRPQRLCTSTKSALTDSAYLRRFLGGCSS